MADKVTQAGAEEYNRACFLVGRFMYHWALLDSAVNDALGKLLGMGNLEEAIVTANANFRAKTNILKSFVDLKGGEANWAKAAIKDIQAIADLSNERNTVVHNVFGPESNGDVRFLHVKANSKLTFPDTVWSPEYFAERWNLAKDLRTRVESLVERMTKKPFTLGELLLEYAKKQPPEQAHGNYLGRLLQGDLNSQTAKSE